MTIIPPPRVFRFVRWILWILWTFSKRWLGPDEKIPNTFHYIDYS